MKRVLLTVGVAVLLMPIASATADAATDPQIRRAILTPAQMRAAAGTEYPMVRDKLDCGSNRGIRGCALSLEGRSGQPAPSRVALPWSAGVSVASSESRAAAWLEEFKVKDLGEGQVVDSSTRTEHATSIAWFNDGYLSMATRVLGAKILTAACVGAALPRSVTARCAQRLLDAQEAKARQVR